MEFNRRVLALAEDRSVPPLERVWFLSIFSTNLDEFYMVRVASWHNKMKLGIATFRPDGYLPKALLLEIRKRVLELIQRQREAMREVMDELEQYGVKIKQISDLTPEEHEATRAYFYDVVFPVLTPLAVDHARPFPFISNLSLNLAVWLQREHSPEEEIEFVRLKVPDVLPRLIDLEAVMQRYNGPGIAPDKFVWLEDVIADNLHLLFPGMHIIEQHPFRVIRNADIDYEHEQEDPLLDISAIIQESLRERQFGSVVRLSVPNDIGERTLERLIHELNVDPESDVYRIDGALGMAALAELTKINHLELKYPPFAPRIPETVTPGKDIFAAIRQSDIVLHHPYDSFLPVEEFFRVAAHDPQVLAIKATLYRVGKNSPIVQSLAEARENDKQVAVLVELKARFDEENNLEWARVLERKGVHVTYGVEELPIKTHAKVALVVRREADGVRRYVHLGTGNYNATTARAYTDLGMFTCDPVIGNDALLLFNRLTGYAPATTYQRLLVAPEYLFDSLIEMIDNETEAARAGKPARLIFKMNQLEEDVVIQKLYQASQAGVQIDLIVRGLCCLRPGIPGYSETIRVRSIVGRFLEHSRIFYFANAPANKQVYMGSADLMRRNLYNRVEVVFPVLNIALQQRVLQLLITCLLDNQNTWELLPDGTYAKLEPAPDEAPFDCHQVFIQSSFGIEGIPPQFEGDPTIE
ncbi:MAG: polyphosphate kinase 1 [Anaerolineae bacterium]|nr:polyphosphate kinase 1 [Anaerolineae bacterium]